MATPVDAVGARHRHILQSLDEAGRVEVAELATCLAVAQETVRRDLRLLEQQGQLQRVHGGAVRRSDPPLTPVDGLDVAFSAGELALARLVVDRLPRTGTLLLGTSTLLEGVAETLSRQDLTTGRLTVVTDSLDAAVRLSRNAGVHVYNLGGTVDEHSRGQTGDWALQELNRLHVDLAVLPCSGIDAAGDVYADSPMTAAVLTAQIAAADRVWLVAPAEVLDRRGFVRAGSVLAVERVFTTARTPRVVAATRGWEGPVDVICASMSADSVDDSPA